MHVKRTLLIKSNLNKNFILHKNVIQFCNKVKKMELFLIFTEKQKN